MSAEMEKESWLTDHSVAVIVGIVRWRVVWFWLRSRACRQFS